MRLSFAEKRRFRENEAKKIEWNFARYRLSICPFYYPRFLPIHLATSSIDPNEIIESLPKSIFDNSSLLSPRPSLIVLLLSSIDTLPILLDILDLFTLLLIPQNLLRLRITFTLDLSPSLFVVVPIFTLLAFDRVRRIEDCDAPLQSSQ